jgi:hypothetical protein
MTVFMQKLEMDVSLLECDLCGTQQNKWRDPQMEERTYTETVSGSHGHDYQRTSVYHLCPACRNRLGELVQALRSRGESGKQKTRYTELFKILDALLEEPK